MSLLMEEIDGSEGVGNPRRVKRTRRVRHLHSCHVKVSPVCAEILGCGELVLVQTSA